MSHLLGGVISRRRNGSKLATVDPLNCERLNLPSVQRELAQRDELLQRKSPVAFVYASVVGLTEAER